MILILAAKTVNYICCQYFLIYSISLLWSCINVAAVEFVAGVSNHSDQCQLTLLPNLAQDVPCRGACRLCAHFCPVMPLKVCYMRYMHTVFAFKFDVTTHRTTNLLITRGFSFKTVVTFLNINMLHVYI